MRFSFTGVGIFLRCLICLYYFLLSEVVEESDRDSTWYSEFQKLSQIMFSPKNCYSFLSFSNIEHISVSYHRKWFLLGITVHVYIWYWFLSILPLMCRNVFWCCYLFIDMINIIVLHEFFQPKWLQLKTQTFQCIACCVISETERDYMYNQ